MESKRLFKVAEMVEQALVAYPETRSSDDLLIVHIYRDYYGIQADKFINVLVKRKEMKLPSFESIGRARRKLQEQHEFLRGTDYTEDLRMKEQEAYLEFARS